MWAGDAELRVIPVWIAAEAVGVVRRSKKNWKRERSREKMVPREAYAVRERDVQEGLVQRLSCTDSWECFP